MKKKLATLTGLFAIFVCSIFLIDIFKPSALGQFAAPPNNASGASVIGYALPGYVVRWSSKYGATTAIEASQWLFEATTGLGINTTSPTSTFQVNGSAVGTVVAIINSLSAPTSDVLQLQANGTNILKVAGTTLGTNAALTVAPLNVSTTGQILNSPTSNTADIEEFQVNGATVARVTQNGQIIPHVYTKSQIDTLVPDQLGAIIECVNCAVPYTVCEASGTLAAQWTVPGSVGSKGCGTNN